MQDSIKSTLPTPNSVVLGVSWPAIPDANNSTYLALLYQLEKSQWLPPAELEKHQLSQLTDLLSHAYRHVPYYQERLQPLAEKNFALDSWEELQQLPVLTRSRLQQSNNQLRATAMPKDHMPIREGRTTGSTGAPIITCSTKVTEIFRHTLSLRRVVWHDIDTTQSVANLRLIDSKEPGDTAVSQSSTAGVFPVGTFHSFSVDKPMAEQLAWLQSVDPGRIITHPTVLRELAKASLAGDLVLTRLKYLSTQGEVVSPELRDLCREAWNLPVIDVYSCREINSLAIQCPEHDHYHVQSERIKLEILDEKDRPCAPGEIGRIVITDLHNFAQPLIRYEIGDYGEFGEPCACGRTLPVLKRIVGRTRNMAVLPSGQFIWPNLGFKPLSNMVPIKQIRAIQHDALDWEYQVVFTTPVGSADRSAFETSVAGFVHRLHPDFRVRITYVDEIPRSAGGKYEDFMCLIDRQ